MNYKLTTPCSECPFLKANRRHYRRIKEFASGEFACHRACKLEDDGDGGEHFVPRGDDKTPHCAGALIYNEKRGQPHQMARICERLGLFDPSKLDMKADV